MSRRQDIQSATGEALSLQPFGKIQVVRTSAPAGGEVGFAPGCEWFVPSQSTGAGSMYTNIGGNGVGSNPTATWIESDPTSSGGFQFGGSLASTGYMRGSGNLFMDVQAAAGISPSANSLFKIVAKYTLPANALNALGRGIQVTVWATAAATANNKQLQVVFGASNTAPAVDGTVTLTGGTAIGDTGTLTTNNGGILLQCQLFKRGAANSNTQDSMTTSIVGGGTHGGVGLWTDQTFTENAAALIVVVAKTTTATTDLLYNGMEITAFN